MTNEEIVIVRKFAAIGLFLTAIVMMLFYVYWQQTKAIAAMFKSTIVALLIGLGILDDTDNNNSAAS
jgi:putative flippase GtrA